MTDVINECIEQIDEYREAIAGGELVVEVTGEDGREDYCLYGYSEYDDSSVLAGQPRKTFVCCFGECDMGFMVATEVCRVKGIELQPRRGGGSLSGSLANHSGLPSVPPSDFDPADAGESWDEDY